MNNDCTQLMKITYAEFGQCSDRPFLFGLHLCFSGSGTGVCDNGKYLVNISPECKWDSLNQRNHYMFEIMETVNKILEDAKVNKVSQLVGKPVLVTFDGPTLGASFKDFRILTEVI